MSFELFARPALRKLAGRADIVAEPVRATVAAGDATPGRRQAASRPGPGVARGRPLLCERAGAQASNVLSGMAAANGLALLHDGDGVEAGADVSVLLL